MSQTVAVFGATGAQGAPVVVKALAKGMQVRAVARDAGKIAAMHPAAEACSADLSDAESVARALEGVDAAFVHLPIPGGPDDAPNWLGNLIQCAIRTGLPLLVYTTGGPTGARYPTSVTIDGGTLGADALRNSGVPTIILQPTLYLENLLPEVFLPRLRSEGVLDYPPLRQDQRVTWVSHEDQATIAVAALGRPDLAGNSYEIGTPDALTGAELAEILTGWIGRNVVYAPISPVEFGKRIGTALNSPGAEFALTDLYGALITMEDDQLAIDISAVEEIFGVTLTSVADHIEGWGAA